MNHPKKLNNTIINEYINEFEKNPRAFSNRAMGRYAKRIKEEEERMGIAFLDAIQKYSNPDVPEFERESYFVFYVQLLGIINCIKNDKKSI